MVAAAWVIGFLLMTPIQGDRAPAQDQAPSAMTLHLIRLAFPETQEGLEKVVLPDFETRKPCLHEIEPVTCAPLGSDWMVLVANATTLDEDGYPNMYHVAPGLLNLIWFRKSEGDWQMAQFEQNIAISGSYNHLGEISFHPLPEGRLLLVIEGLFNGVGTTYRYLNLFELIPGKSVQLARTIRLYADNRDEWSIVNCYHVEGKWSFASGSTPCPYPDLIFQFEGTESTYSGEETVQALCCNLPGWKVTKTIKQQATYRFSNGTYQCTEGHNPMDDIHIYWNMP